MDSGQIDKLTGSIFPYQYRELLQCTDQQVSDYCTETRRLCAEAANSFNSTANTEWLIRSYLALKFILGATVLGSSAEYAERKNIQISLPYLNYYTVLNCCRAFLLTLPCLKWRGDKSIELTHSAIINVTIDKLRRLDENAEFRWKLRLLAAKDQRELFSYRFPASGLRVFGNDKFSVGEAISLARLLTELTQVNLACLESSVRKFEIDPPSLLDNADTWRMMQYELKSRVLIDHDDYHRVAYFYRKFKIPVALIALATEGLVEDFFGAWKTDQSEEETYDPDDNWSLLLDIR